MHFNTYNKSKCSRSKDKNVSKLSIKASSKSSHKHERVVKPRGKKRG